MGKVVVVVEEIVRLEEGCGSGEMGGVESVGGRRSKEAVW